MQRNLITFEHFIHPYIMKYVVNYQSLSKCVEHLNSDFTKHKVIYSQCYDSVLVKFIFNINTLFPLKLKEFPKEALM